MTAEPNLLMWDEPWSRAALGGQGGWAHNGIVVTAAGLVLTPHPERSEMLVLSQDGRLAGSWGFDGVQAHGLTLVQEDGTEFLWIADNGSIRHRQADGSYLKSGPADPIAGAAAKYTLDGRLVVRLPAPPLDVYRTADYCPTSVAVSEAGEVWVADGYGQHLVHRYDASGSYLLTIDGSSGAGRFAQPHAVHVDRRGCDHELLVADRANRRVQVFDLSGGYLRSFGADFLLSPSAFAQWGDRLVIAELDGRLTVVGADERLLGRIGETSDRGRSRPGWPNALTDSGTVRPPLVSGEFNSPHGLTVDADLNLYVTEFVVGGRLVKLRHPGDNGSGVTVAIAP